MRKEALSRAGVARGVAFGIFPRRNLRLQHLLERGHAVRAMVHKEDERSEVQLAAWSGLRARTKLVRSMTSISANSVILSRPCTSRAPGSKIAKPTAPPAPSGYRTDGSDSERSSGLRGRNRDGVRLVSPCSRYNCAIAQCQVDLRAYNIVGTPLGLTLTFSTAPVSPH